GSGVHLPGVRRAPRGGRGDDRVHGDSRRDQRAGRDHPGPGPAGGHGPGGGGPDAWHAARGSPGRLGARRAAPLLRRDRDVLDRPRRAPGRRRARDRDRLAASRSAAVVSPASAGGRSARGLQTRETIAAAARSLFLERGYEATTMRAVAERAGVSLGNAYYYFA